MSDKFRRFTRGLSSPPFGGFPVTPNDVTDLPTVTRALNAGGSGTVHVTMQDGSDVTIFIAAGGLLPLRVTRIWATGTTATDIVGLY